MCMDSQKYLRMWRSDFLLRNNVGSSGTIQTRQCRQAISGSVHTRASFVFGALERSGLLWKSIKLENHTLKDSYTVQRVGGERTRNPGFPEVGERQPTRLTRPALFLATSSRMKEMSLRTRPWRAGQGPSNAGLCAGHASGASSLRACSTNTVAMTYSNILRRSQWH